MRRAIEVARLTRANHGRVRTAPSSRADHFVCGDPDGLHRPGRARARSNELPGGALCCRKSYAWMHQRSLVHGEQWITHGCAQGGELSEWRFGCPSGGPTVSSGQGVHACMVCTTKSGSGCTQRAFGDTLQLQLAFDATSIIFLSSNKTSPNFFGIPFPAVLTSTETAMSE